MSSLERNGLNSVEQRKIWGQMCLLRGDLEMAGQRMPFGSVLGVFFLRRKNTVVTGEI